MSGSIYRLTVNYTLNDAAKLTEYDKIARDIAKRKPSSSGCCLMTNRRDLVYCYSFPAAARRAKARFEESNFFKVSRLEKTVI